MVLDGYFLSEFKNMWKEEEVKITVFLPENVNIYVDNTAKNFLYYTKNKQELYYKDMGGHHFTMSAKVLDCTDCKEDKTEVKKISKSKKKEKIKERI